MSRYTPEEERILLDLMESVDPDNYPYLESLCAALSIPHISIEEAYKNMNKQWMSGTEDDRFRGILFEYPLSDVPLHLYDKGQKSVGMIAKWRLMIGK